MYNWIVNDVMNAIVAHIVESLGLFVSHSMFLLDIHSKLKNVHLAYLFERHKQVDIQSARYTYIRGHKIVLYAERDSIQRFLGSANWMSTFNPWILEQEDFYNYYYT